MKQFSTKRATLSILAAASMWMTACGPSTSITGSWKDPEVQAGQGNIKTVFVSALTGNMTIRTKLESDIAAEAERRGFKVIKSTELYPQTFSKENAPSKEQIVQQIRAKGADAILTAALVNKENETRYVPGTTTYMPMSYGYYGGFGRYYGAMGPMMYDPGYYTTDKSYYIETNLYRVSDEKLIWSAQSKTVNPNGLDDFTSGYIKSLGKRMEADGLVSK
jgi:hypothetical protein